MLCVTTAIPRIQRIHPPYITGTGDSITVLATVPHDIGPVTCVFDNVQQVLMSTTTLYLNDSAVQCDVPQMPVIGKWIGVRVLPEVNSEMIILPQWQAVPLHQILYAPPPLVVSVTSHVISGLGDTAVVFRGLNFGYPYKLRCNFGSFGSTLVTVLSLTLGECSSPIFSHQVRVPQNVILQVETLFPVRKIAGIFMMDVVSSPLAIEVTPSVVALGKLSSVVVLTNSYELPERSRKWELYCMIGYERVAGIAVNNSSVRCAVPPFVHEATAIVTVGFAGITPSKMKSQVALTYLSPIKLLSVTPMGASTRGGREVILLANQAGHNNVFCLFDDQIVLAVSVDLLRIACHAPKHREGWVSLRLSNELGDVLSANALMFEYVNFAGSFGLFPTNGIVHKDTRVQVSAQGLSTRMPLWCAFAQNHSARGNLVSEKLCLVTIPGWCECSVPADLTPGETCLTLRVANESIFSHEKLHFAENIIVHSISPPAGSSRGGVRVRFNLKEVLPEVVYVCLFGAIIVPSVLASVYGAYVECISPAHTHSERITVALSANGYDFFPSTLNARSTFQYVIEPSVISYQPTLGFRGGGTTLFINGSGFDNALPLWCSFDNQTRVAASWINTTMISCAVTTNIHHASYVDVSVISQDEVFVSKLQPPFTLISALENFSITPSSIPRNFNGTLRITGSGMHPSKDWKCQINSTNTLVQLAATWLSSTDVLCDVYGLGQIAEDLASLKISANGQEWSHAQALGLSPQISMAAAFPSQITCMRNNEILVSGSGFLDSLELMCVFNSVPVPAVYIDDTSVRCMLHAVPEVKIVRVELMTPSNFHVNGVVDLDCVLPIELYSVTPTTAWTIGGSTIVLSFVADLPVVDLFGLRCCFGSITCVSGKQVNLSAIACNVPPMTAGTIAVFASLGSTERGWVNSSESLFEYAHTPDFYNIQPRRLQWVLGSSFAITGAGFEPLSFSHCILRGADAELVLLIRQSTSNLILCEIEEVETIALGRLPSNVEAIVRSAPYGEINTGLNMTLTAPSEVRHAYLETVDVDEGRGLLLQGFDFDIEEKLLCRYDVDDEAISVEARIINSTLVRCPVPGPWSGLTNRIKLSLWDSRFHLINWGNDGWFKIEPTRDPSPVHKEWNLWPNHGLQTGGEATITLPSGMQAEHGWKCCFGFTLCMSVNLNVAKNTTTVVIPPSNVSGLISVELKNGDGFSVSLYRNWFRYIEPPEVISIAPASGRFIAGRHVIVRGRNLGIAMSFNCHFGDFVGLAKRIFDNYLTCSVPSSIRTPSGKLTVPFALTWTDQNNMSARTAIYARKNLTYTFIETPTLVTGFADLVPATSDIANLIEISVLGQGFINSTLLSCRINRMVVSARLEQSNKVICASIAAKTIANSFEVSVSNDGLIFSFSIITDARRQFQSPTISFITPQTGITEGGDRLLVVGAGFLLERVFNCTFGWDINVFIAEAAKIINTTHAWCTVPPKATDMPWFLPVSLSDVSKNSKSNAVMFRYVEHPSILAIKPSWGVAGLTKSITIQGSGFSQIGENGCKLRSVLAPHKVILATIAWRSYSEVICSLPDALDLGAYEVCLHSGGGRVTLHCLNRFDVVELPTVMRLTPAEGSTIGGTKVFFVAANLNPELECCFDDLCSRLVVFNSSTAVCITPSHNAGIAKFSLLSQALGRVTTELTFRYTSGPYISKLPPKVLVPRVWSTVNAVISGLELPSDFSATCDYGALGLWEAVVSQEGQIDCSMPNADALNGYAPLDMSIVLNTSTHGLRRLAVGQIEVLQPSTIHEVIPSVVGITNTVLQDTFLLLRGYFYLPSNVVTCHFNCIDGMVTKIGRGGFISDEEIECEIEGGFQVEGTCTVDIFYKDAKLTNSSATVDIRREIILQEVFPRSAPLIGGIDIAIIATGFAFGDKIHCHFGVHREVEATIWSPGHANCTSPAILNTSEAQLDLWLSCGSLESNRIQFSFYDSNEILSIHPMFGPENGGTTIIVIAGNLLDSTSCVFDNDTRILATTMNSTAMSCVSPNLPVGTHTFKITHPSGDRVSNAFISFETYPVEKLTDIEPPGGILSTEFSTRVIITGENFVDTPLLACGDGDRWATQAIFLSPSKVECYLPFMKAGNVQIRVANNGVDYSESSVVFEALTRMTLVKIAPQSGPSQGGTIVNLVGVFVSRSELMCSFGDIDVKATQVNASLIQCISPPSVANVTVQINVKVHSTFAFVECLSSAMFSYQQPFSITRIVPDLVSQSMDPVELTLCGSSLNSIAFIECKFSNGYTSKVALRDGHIQCQLNAQVAGVVTVTLTTANYAFDVIRVDQPIQIVLPSEPSFVYPQAFDERGGTELEVSLSYSSPVATSFLCKIADVTVPALRISDIKLRCIAPRLEPGRVLIYTSQDNATWSRTFVEVDVFKTPSVHSVTPDRVLVTGGSLVTVRGTSFKSFRSGALCIFGKLAVPATVVSPTGIKCVSPALVSSSSLPVRVSLNGFDISADSASIEVCDSTNQLVKSIAANGHELKGNEVTTNAANNQALASIFENTRQLTSESMCVIAFNTTNELPVDDENTQSESPCSEIASAVFVEHQEGPTSLVAIIIGSSVVDTELSCRVGPFPPVRATVLFSGITKCDLPNLPPGQYHLNVLCGFDNRLVATEVVEYVRGALIESAAPTIFPFGNSYEINLFGSGFWESVQIDCIYRDQALTAIPAEYRSPTHIVCPTPYRAPPGTLNLTVMTDRVQSVLFNGLISIVDIPVPGTLKYNFGSTSGGYEVAIRLHESGAPYFSSMCKFASNSTEQLTASTLIKVSSNVWELNCLAPALSEGIYSILISPNGCDYVPLSFGFIVHSPIEMTAVNPSVAFAHGGDEVTVIGSGFQSWMKLDCGYRSLEGGKWLFWPTKFVSNSMLTCQTSRARPGYGKLALFPAASVQQNNIGVSFTIKPEAKVHSLYPQNGSAAHTNVVTFRGQGFYPSPKITCHLLDITVPATFVNSSLALCELPRFWPKSVPVGLSFDGFNIVDSLQPFTFLPSFKISDLAIMANQPGYFHSLSVTMLVYPFDSTEHVNCVFYRLRSNGKVLDVAGDTTPARFEHTERVDRRAECRVPHVLRHAGTFGIRLRAVHKDIYSNLLTYESLSASTAFLLQPTSGPPAGGYNISLFGGPFDTKDTFYCRVGASESPGYAISNVELSCLVPKVGQDINEARIQLKIGDLSDWVDTFTTFRYDTIPSIHQISPLFGWSRGGAPISVIGTESSPLSRTNCVFGDISVPASHESKSKLLCYSPSTRYGGTVAFRVQSDGIWWREPHPVMFTSIRPPIVSSVDPESGSMLGGTEVAMSGNFSSIIAHSSIIYCVFGANKLSKIHLLTEQELRCLAPATHRAGAAELGLVIDAIDIYWISFNFEYTNVIVFDSIAPTVVNSLKNGHLSIYGESFWESPRAFCRFGRSSHHFPLEYVSTSEIRCPYAKLQIGWHGVFVSFNGADEVKSGFQLYLRKPSTLLLQSPAIDFASGGATLTFDVRNSFFSHSLACQFGTEVTPATLRGTKIVCSVPPASDLNCTIQRVNLTVLSAGYPYSGDVFEFSYVRSPDIKRAEVVVGDTPLHQKNSSVWVCGRYYGSGISFLRLDAVNDQYYQQFFAESTETRNTTEECRRFVFKVPDVNCSPSCGMYLSVNNQTFEFTGHYLRLDSLPDIHSIHPSTASYRGGEHIQIHGRNLMSSTPLFCQFGIYTPVRVVLESDRSGLCVSPRNQPEQLLLKLLRMSSSINQSFATVNAFNFTIIGPIELTGIRPTAGLDRGGSEVLVHGKGFTEHSALRCEFGELSVKAFYINSTHLMCQAPPMLHNIHNVIVRVRLGSETTSNLHITYSYVPLPGVTAVQPSLGVSGKQYSIQLQGTGFSVEPNLWCRIGDFLPQLGKVVSPTLARCSLELFHVVPHIIPIRLSYDGINFFDTGRFFKVVETAMISEMQPEVIFPSLTKSIRIVGRQFDNSIGWLCEWGSANVTTQALFLSSTAMQCMVPPRKWLRPGQLSIQLRRSDMDGFITNSFQVGIYEAPEVFDVFPSRASVFRDGFTQPSQAFIIVKGKGFIPFQRISCYFGNLREVDGVFESPHQVRCQVPLSPVAQLVSCGLSFDGGETKVFAKRKFTFFEAMTISNIFPVSGALTGGSVIHVYGEGFELSESIQCAFGANNDIEYAFVVSGSEIVCIVPPGYALGPVDVVVHSADRFVSGRLVNAFTYTKPISVMSVSPRTAFELTETQVDIYGQGFVRSPALTCDLGEQFLAFGRNIAASISPAVWVSSTHVKCWFSRKSSHLGRIRVGLSNNAIDFIYADESESIEFLTRFDLSGVFPTSGIVSGGTRVIINGRNFVDAYRLWCKFGDIVVQSEAITIAHDSVICLSPPYISYETPRGRSSLPTNVEISVSVNDREFISTNRWFSYYSDPSVLEVAPLKGSIEGSTKIRVLGAGFSSGDNSSAWCRFGSDYARATVLAEDTIECIAPASQFTGSVPVEVSLNDGIDFTKNGVLYSYMLPPRIRQVQPASGPEDGSTQITIHGLNFYSSLLTRCCFGDNSHCSQGWMIDITKISCSVPPVSMVGGNIESKRGAIRVPILLSLNGQDFLPLKTPFEYYLQPTVVAVSPTTANADGGTLVTIVGRNFMYSPFLQCAFGTELSPAGLVNRSAIQCFVPRQSPNTVNVSVSLNGQSFIDGPSKLTIIQFPVVNEIWPKSGSASGGYTVQLRGNYFPESGVAMSCSFTEETPIGLEVTITDADWLSPTAVQCMVPGVLREGRVSVSMLVGGILPSHNQPCTFQYVADVQLYGLDPWLAVNSGGDTLAVLGEGFRRTLDMECCFEVMRNGDNSSLCVFADFITQNRIHCTIPRLVGEKSVNVSIHSSTTKLSDTIELHLHNPVAITNVVPHVVSLFGGTHITVRGWKFLLTRHLSCCFDDQVVPAIFVNASQIECTAPARQAKDQLEVRVSNNGVTCSNSGDTQQVIFQHPPQVESVIPSFGSQLGEGVVSVKGRHFAKDSKCVFGDQESLNSTFVSDLELTCMVPPSSYAQTVYLSVVRNDERIHSKEPITFMYTPAEEVLAAHPQRVSAIQGGRITLKTRNARNSASLSCFFDGIRVSAVYETSDCVHCLLQHSMITPGIKKVFLSNDGVQLSKRFSVVELISPPTIVTVNPTKTTVNGGNTISILGSKLDQVSICRFGSVLVPAFVMNGSCVLCRTPPQAVGGNYTLRLMTDGAEIPSPDYLIEYLSSWTAETARSRELQASEHDRMKQSVVPIVRSISPLRHSYMGGTSIVVRGHAFQNTIELRCRFGLRAIVAARYLSSHEIVCVFPRVQPGRYEVQITNDGMHYSNSPVVIEAIAPPYVNSIEPSYGPQSGGTEVTVYGMNFLHDELTFCRFGDVHAQAVKFVSTSEIACVAPPQPKFHESNGGGISSKGVIVTVTNNNASDNYPTNPVFFTYSAGTDVVSVSPRSGPLKGGTQLLLRWHNAEIHDTAAQGSVLCRFGANLKGVVQATVLSSTLVTCITPPASQSGKYFVQVSVNSGYDFTDSKVAFEYEPDVFVDAIVPNHGPALYQDIVRTANETGRGISTSTVRSHTVVTVFGRGFANTPLLSCYFNSIPVPAAFVSEKEVSCDAPWQAPGSVVVRVSAGNGIDKSTNGQRFLYVADMSITRVTPAKVLLAGGTPVFVQGRNFANHTGLECRFGRERVQATYISSTVVGCVSPRYTQHKHHNLLTTGASDDQIFVTLELSSNGIDLTASGMEITYLASCPLGHVCYRSRLTRPTWSVPELSPNGTFADGSGNFTLCPRGSFQPRRGQRNCLPCPIGFFCPDDGLSKPILCPAGSICNEHGLGANSLQSCPAGLYCRKGTKSDFTNDFIHNPDFRVDYETHLAVFIETDGSAQASLTAQRWRQNARIAPESGSRQLEFAPNDTSCTMRLCVEHDNEDDLTAQLSSPNISLLAERPYPCPIGTYCRRGVASRRAKSNKQVPATNFSVPQTCFAGFFCPRGSSTPEGVGPCPTGHYCQTAVDAVVCPIGYYCPGVGNMRPLACLPGTYNPGKQKSACVLCPSGYVCPQFAMSVPELCPAGFVCVSTGLSGPALLCPPGYVCHEGTRTLDPSSTIPFRPKPCPAGMFCLGGVAQVSKVIEWVPHQAEEGSRSPQQCTEGTYCAGATSTVSGTGACFAGHYCPPGSTYPISSPVGTFAGETGAVAATMCFPGTYTPLKSTVACEICPAGHSCPNFGTYVPTLCPHGTYRSLADSVTCRSCPEGTWSPHTGLTDISHCEMCPAGRVCGAAGMTALSASLPCSAGFVCGVGTSRRAQFVHDCPAGHFCGPATSLSKQYTYPCGAGNVCARGTTDLAQNKSSCPDGRFCPRGTSNASSALTACPSGTWTLDAGEDELLDCAVRPVPICDKKPLVARYYPQFDYVFQGYKLHYDSAVEGNRTGEVEAIAVVYPVNASNSDRFWVNDSVDAIRVCPTSGPMHGGTLLTVIGRNFKDTDRLVCRFQQAFSDDSSGDDGESDPVGWAVTMPAFYVNSTRVKCRSPLWSSSFAAASASELIRVRVSNYAGVFFSRTAATFTYIAQMDTTSIAEASKSCLVWSGEEEGDRPEDNAWFVLRGLSKAKLAFDFRHVPPDMQYDEHYKIALYVQNSTCEDQQCDSRGVVQPSGSGIETSPCRRPVELPPWFSSTAIDKHGILNLTVLALEDVLLKVEIHIVYGLYTSAAPLFVNSTTVRIQAPTRTNVTLGVDGVDIRPLSRAVSFERSMVTRDYSFFVVYFGSDGDVTSAPLNLPPKYESYARGRVLLSHNVSSESASATIPLVLDSIDSVRTNSTYWAMPYGSASLTHDMVLKYRETFHEMYLDPTDATGSQYLFKFEKVLLSYLPFFSNCMQFDSYMPIFDIFESEELCELPALTSETGSYGRNWWRRAFPPLPNQDDIRHVGPLDVGQEPIADLCIADIQCNYEEDLASADVTPRWFEQGQDTPIFYLLREAAPFGEYLRGGAYYDDLYDAFGSDYFIPVTVDNSAASNLGGDCTNLCFPRSVTLDIAYYQVDKHVKRIIMAKLILADYDRDATNTEYTLSINLHPLDYLNLIVQFAFEQEVYVGLFFVIGGAMTAAAFIFWLFVRITSILQSPPRFRFSAMFALIAPPISVGVALALAPISAVVVGFYVLLNGYKYYISNSTYCLIDNIVKHYMDTKIDPDEVEATRFGRLGLCFLAFGLYLIVLGTQIFLPKSISISEKLLAEKEITGDEGDADEVRERTTWWPTQWKRANMVFTSVVLGLFLVLLLELSFWSEFGNYMFYVIVAMELVNRQVESWTEGRVKELLLMAPLLSACNLIGGLMTFGATDFLDFLLGSTLDFGMMLLIRVYMDTAIEATSEFISEILTYCWEKLRVVGRAFLVLFRSLSRSTAAPMKADDEGEEGEKKDKKEEKKEEEEETAETVEPIIEFYAGCSMDRLAMFYQPVLIIMMMFFREELQLPILYNIREKDMEIYLWYSLIILFFQLVVEVFVLNVVEIFHGWKLYDYLVYCRYRFLQREKRWKGMEPNLDECIAENLRTLDQMCFSSQFFMMCTIHITGVVFFSLALEIMARAGYNMFGDPAMPLLFAFVMASAAFVRHAVFFLAVHLEVWKIKHENTAWLAPPDDDDEFGVPRWDELEKIKGASHEAYLMNQRLTSETFRHKFLNYNRSWLVAQLPNILTPRTLRRARPYLLAQFAKILDSLNPQISDDDEDDENAGRPRFGPVTLSAPSRSIARLWLARARRILRLKTAVQPLIQQARKAECEMCLSRRQLQVELAIPIEVLGDKFESQSVADEFDVAGWKQFFAQHEKFKTLCLNCIVHLRTSAATSAGRGFDGFGGGFGGDGSNQWPATPLSAASYALMQKWYRKAQDRVFGKSGKRRRVLDVSDDEEELLAHSYEWAKQPVQLNAASTALARKWLMTARQSLRSDETRRARPPPSLSAPIPAAVRIGGGTTPIPKPAMKMGAAGGDGGGKVSTMRRK